MNGMAPRMRCTSISSPPRGAWSICSAALYIILCIIEISIGYNVPNSFSAWIYFAFMLLAALFFAAAPLYGALCIIMCWQVGYYVPFPTSSMIIIAGLALMAFLGTVSLPLALATDLVSASNMAIAIYTGAFDISPNNMLLLILTMVTMSIIGFGIRRHRERHEFLVRLGQQRRKDRIIADLHDSVCNDLSLALMQLDTYAMTTRSDTSREPLDRARESVTRALSKTRMVLDGLQNDIWDSIQTDNMDNVALTPFIDEQRERLEKAGFSGILLGGDSDTDGVRITNDKNRAAIITGFIRETVNNIINHADHAYEYVMLIGVRSNTLHIEISDTPRSDIPSYESNGMGLNFYRDQVESLGGTITIQREPRLWSMQAAIPLSGETTIPRPQRT